MDIEKALAATAAIRHIVETLPAGFQPEPAAGQDVQRELNVIREIAPQSCRGKIRWLSSYLDMLLIPDKRAKYEANPTTRMTHLQKNVLNILARIAAELISQGPETAGERVPESDT